jgi:hypothetical protein
MSEYASVLDRARGAFAAVARLEEALARAPERTDLQTNLLASRKLARQSQEQLYRFAETRKIEVCNYRLLPESAERYSLQYVSGSFLQYQLLFSQIHDAKKNGPKIRATMSKDILEESSLEFGYSYGGSLGVVLLMQSDRDLLEGKMDHSIEALFQVLDIDSRDAVRDVAENLGKAVVRRIHDWSDTNIKGGFAADIRWNRSDGRQLGEVIERRRMESIVHLIEATSEEKISELGFVGYLLGGDLRSKSFHFVVPNGETYKGHLADDFSGDTEMTLGRLYRARIKETATTTYATDKTERSFELLFLASAEQLDLKP